MAKHNWTPYIVIIMLSLGLRANSQFYDYPSPERDYDSVGGEENPVEYESKIPEYSEYGGRPRDPEEASIPKEKRIPNSFGEQDMFEPSFVDPRHFHPQIDPPLDTDTSSSSQFPRHQLQDDDLTHLNYPYGYFPQVEAPFSDEDFRPTSSTQSLYDNVHRPPLDPKPRRRFVLLCKTKHAASVDPYSDLSYKQNNLSPRESLLRRFVNEGYKQSTPSSMAGTTRLYIINMNNYRTEYVNVGVDEDFVCATHPVDSDDDFSTSKRIENHSTKSQTKPFTRFLTRKPFQTRKYYSHSKQSIYHSLKYSSTSHSRRKVSLVPFISSRTSIRPSSKIPIYYFPTQSTAGGKEVYSPVISQSKSSSVKMRTNIPLSTQGRLENVSTRIPEFPNRYRNSLKTSESVRKYVTPFHRQTYKITEMNLKNKNGKYATSSQPYSTAYSRVYRTRTYPKVPYKTSTSQPALFQRSTSLSKEHKETRLNVSRSTKRYSETKEKYTPMKTYSQEVLFTSEQSSSKTFLGKNYFSTETYYKEKPLSSFRPSSNFYKSASTHLYRSSPTAKYTSLTKSYASQGKYSLASKFPDTLRKTALLTSYSESPSSSPSTNGLQNVTPLIKVYPVSSKHLVNLRTYTYSLSSVNNPNFQKDTLAVPTYPKDSFNSKPISQGVYTTSTKIKYGFPRTTILAEIYSNVSPSEFKSIYSTIARDKYKIENAQSFTRIFQSFEPKLVTPRPNIYTTNRINDVEKTTSSVQTYTKTGVYSEPPRTHISAISSGNSYNFQKATLVDQTYPKEVSYFDPLRPISHTLSSEHENNFQKATSEWITYSKVRPHIKTQETYIYGRSTERNSGSQKATSQIQNPLITTPYLVPPRPDVYSTSTGSNINSFQKATNPIEAYQNLSPYLGPLTTATYVTSIENGYSFKKATPQTLSNFSPYLDPLRTNVYDNSNERNGYIYGFQKTTDSVEAYQNVPNIEPNSPAIYLTNNGNNYNFKNTTKQMQTNSKFTDNIDFYKQTIYATSTRGNRNIYNFGKATEQMQIYGYSNTHIEPIIPSAYTTRVKDGYNIPKATPQMQTYLNSNPPTESQRQNAYATSATNINFRKATESKQYFQNISPYFEPLGSSIYATNVGSTRIQSTTLPTQYYRTISPNLSLSSPAMHTTNGGIQTAQTYPNLFTYLVPKIYPTLTSLDSKNTDSYKRKYISLPTLTTLSPTSSAPFTEAKNRSPFDNLYSYPPLSILVTSPFEENRMKYQQAIPVETTNPYVISLSSVPNQDGSFKERSNASAFRKYPPSIPASYFGYPSTGSVLKPLKAITPVAPFRTSTVPAVTPYKPDNRKEMEYYKSEDRAMSFSSSYNSSDKESGVYNTLNPTPISAYLTGTTRTTDGSYKETDHHSTPLTSFDVTYKPESSETSFDYPNIQSEYSDYEFSPTNEFESRKGSKGYKMPPIQAGYGSQTKHSDTSQTYPTNDNNSDDFNASTEPTTYRQILESEKYTNSKEHIESAISNQYSPINNYTQLAISNQSPLISDYIQSSRFTSTDYRKSNPSSPVNIYTYLSSLTTKTPLVYSSTSTSDIAAHFPTTDIIDTTSMKYKSEYFTRSFLPASTRRYSFRILPRTTPSNDNAANIYHQVNIPKYVFFTYPPAYPLLTFYKLTVSQNKATGVYNKGESDQTPQTTTMPSLIPIPISFGSKRPSASTPKYLPIKFNAGSFYGVPVQRVNIRVPGSVLRKPNRRVNSRTRPDSRITRIINRRFRVRPGEKQMRRVGNRPFVNPRSPINKPKQRYVVQSSSRELNRQPHVGPRASYG